MFALNRHLTEPMPMIVTMTGCDTKVIRAARTLYHPNLNASNTRDAPDTVRPAPLDGATIVGDTLRVTLPPASWNVIRLG